MIKQHPIWGWGHGGFVKNYMNVQASYFEQHPNSDYSMLADNIHHPLNEYMLIVVNYGFFGITFLLIIAGLVFLYYKKHPSEDGQIGIEILSFIAVLSFLSYPFQYLFTWLITLLSFFLIFNKTILRFTIKKVYLYFILLCIGGTIAYKNLIDKVWNSAMINCECGRYQEGLIQYARVYPFLKNNTPFLYNYAYQLYKAGLYKDALKIAEECNQDISDYDLSLLLGDINIELGKKREAIQKYELAHNMCPNRFAPLCAIYNVYRIYNDLDSCKQMAKIILNKPIKIKSSETMDYIYYIKNDLSKLAD